MKKYLVGLGIGFLASLLTGWTLGCGNQATPATPHIDKILLSVDGVPCTSTKSVPDGNGGAAVTFDCGPTNGDNNVYTVQEPVWP